MKRKKNMDDSTVGCWIEFIKWITRHAGQRVSKIHWVYFTHSYEKGL